jgi:Flp pilus assembly protein TadD
VADEPSYALAHTALSVFYGRLGRHEEAVAHGRKVCELEPDDPFSFVSLSIVCQKAGRNAEAEEAMRFALEKQWALRERPGG